MKNITTIGIGSCVCNVTKHSNKYVIAKHTPIGVGFMWRSTVEDVGDATDETVGDATDEDVADATDEDVGDTTNDVSFNTNSKNYFGLDFIERFARDLLDIENENNRKDNKKMISNKEDKPY